MKNTFAFDTSALISLGHTGLFDLIFDNFEIIISEGVLEELRGISKIDDEDGEVAKIWLADPDRFKIKKCKRKEVAEDELFLICKEIGMPLVTDDINAVKRFEDEITCFFSVHVLYFAFKKDLISKESALISVEKMKTQRDWKRNIIAITSKTLFT